PAAVGPTRRDERSSSFSPSRFSSERTASETAGWVTPSASAACENEPRSQTATNAASCRVSTALRGDAREARPAPELLEAIRERGGGALDAQLLEHGQLGVEPVRVDPRPGGAHDLPVLRRRDALPGLEQLLVQLLAGGRADDRDPDVAAGLLAGQADHVL